MLLIYGHGEAGSIIKRMKALDVSFLGVFATSAPLDPLWPKLMGADGDFVVTGGQWHPALQSTCKMFGSAANYSVQFEARFGRAPDYHAALESNIGLILQYAIQVRIPALAAITHAAIVFFFSLWLSPTKARAAFLRPTALVVAAIR